MAKFTIHSFHLLTCLLSLITAIPNPLTLHPNSFLGNDFGSNIPNSTLAAVIPKDFTITSSLPLDEPILNQRQTLLLTLQLLGTLSLDDFNGEQQSQAWRRQPQNVWIDIVGPLMTAESPLPIRKYALWGVYKAIHSMVAFNDFRPRNYELFWQGTLVGYVSFNNGPHAALVVAGGSPSETGTAAVNQGRLPISQSTLPIATTANLPDNNSGVQLSFKLYGHTIGESNVFMTLFTGILKAAPYNLAERVANFLVNARSFNAFLSFQGEEDLKPFEEFFEYQYLIRLCMQLPDWVLEQPHERWAEAEMVVTVNEKTVGAGVMKWQASEVLGPVHVGSVLSS